MENRNLDKALDIVSKLIMGEQISESKDNSQLYQEYNTNAEVYDIVHMYITTAYMSVQGIITRCLATLTKS